MLRALQRLPQSPGLVLVDGNLPLRLWQGPQRTVIAAANVVIISDCKGVVAQLRKTFLGHSR